MSFWRIPHRHPGQEAQPASPPPLPDKEADEAMALLAGGDAAAALALIAPLAGRHPEIDRYRYRHGVALAAVGERTAALAEMRAAVTMSPSFGVFQEAYMRLLAEAGSVAEARAGYDGLPFPDAHAPVLVAALLEANAPIEEVFAAFGSVFGANCAGAEMAIHDLAHGLVRITMTRDGYRFAVGSDVPARPMLVQRLISYRAYFDALWRVLCDDPAFRSQSALLCVDDLPPPVWSAPVLSPSGSAPDHVLIPDSAFLSSGGYAHFHTMSKACARQWSERIPQAYWRGALTGVAATLDEALTLPRVRLARNPDPRLNAAITSVSQYAMFEPSLSETLAAWGVLQPREPEHCAFAYRWQVDIDGNSNSWPGLYLRLLTGGCVLKLMSPFRQWYYDRLVDRVNVVMVEVIAALPDVIAWCAENEPRTEEIGLAGQALAASMTIETEFAPFVAAWRRAAW
jgi:hypothetical protein